MVGIESATFSTMGFHSVTFPLFMVLRYFPGCLVAFYRSNPISGASRNSTEKRCGGGGKYADWEDHVKCSRF